MLDLSASMDFNDDDPAASPCLNPSHYYQTADSANVHLSSYAFGAYKDHHNAITAGSPYLYSDSSQCADCDFTSIYSSFHWFQYHHYDTSGTRIGVDSAAGCYSKLTATKNALSGFLDSLSTSEVAFTGFGSNGTSMQMTNTVGFTSNYSDIKTALSGASASSSYDMQYTDCVNWLSDTITQRRADGNTRPLKVIFLTDGNPSDDFSEVWNAKLKTFTDNNAFVFPICLTMALNSEETYKLLDLTTNPDYLQSVAVDAGGDIEIALDKELFNIQSVPCMVSLTNKSFTDTLSNYFDFYGFASPGGAATYADPMMGSASYDGSVIDWSVPDGVDTDFSLTYYLKLKDDYRYGAIEDTYETGT